MEIRALTPAEQKYTYAQSMQLEGQTANIGHLRGDFDSSGYGFYTTWTDTRTQWKTDEFKVEFDEVINALRSDKYGLLKNRSAMSAFARQYADSAFKGAIARSTVSVWIRKNTPICCAATPQGATTIFTATAL